MADTTTMNIDVEQRDELEARKNHEREPLKDVVQRLLDDEAPADTVDTGMADSLAIIEERTARMERAIDDLGGR